MKKFILWDNDGVLVDTEKYYLTANRQILSEIDIEITEESFKRISLIEGRSLFMLAIENGYSENDVMELKHERDKIYEKLITHEDIEIPGVAKVLEDLYGKIGMGIVTTTCKDYVNILHKRTGFLKYFDFIITREEYNKAKPSPEPYLAGIKKSGYSAEDCIAVEDTERGLTAALAAGLDTIIIPNQLTKGNAFEGAKLVLDNISSLNYELLKRF